MWLKDEVLYPRLLQSILWIILLHFGFVTGCLLFFKTISWHPFSSIAEWFLYLFHWKTIIYLCILSMLITAFAALNIRFCAVEKHINSTRFERICRSLSPSCLLHVCSTMSLGGIAAYCYDGLFYNFRGETSFIDSYLSSANDFEQTFIIGHGCFTGLMFSLKYFICELYLIKFNTEKDSKVEYVTRQLYDLVKDSFFCVIKAVHWYYLMFVIFGSPLKILTFSYLGNQDSDTESIVYSLLNPKLFLSVIISGMMISLIWSLYLIIFNAFATEHHTFPLKVPVKEEKNKTLASALSCKEFGYLFYLAVLDLKLLAHNDVRRREQLFAISHPGGHPHEWKAISGVCISLLQDFVYKLSEYTFATAAASEQKAPPTKIPNIAFERIKQISVPETEVESFYDKVFCYIREKPTVSYFFDELPNAKLMKLFASSQPFIWMVDALGQFVTVSYTEDKFGVMQQTLREIICLLLDVKMAEEKMPVGLVGIRTYVRDPQGRYEHIHQRLSLKTTVNNVLSSIANTFKEDISGIDLPEEYEKYLQRYLEEKNQMNQMNFLPHFR